MTQPPDPLEEPASPGMGNEASGEAFEDDLRVLAHLRGYPDDLRHFSNLIKQARADFPAPLFAVEHRRLWRRADVEEYAARGQGAG